ncbi:MAG: SDR family oxidoreductase [Anaerolineaceae bacterium]|nr:MAG: SDR family oxidoreductase [Anaerolineaceae bacterium]
MNFDGKRVLITGSSRGIGREIARQFAANGARVAVHYGHDEASARVTRDALDGDGHSIHGGDMADADAVRALVDGAASALGGLDILVNNAGIYHEHDIPAMDYAAWGAVWSRTLAVNLVGSANAIFCAVPHMMAAGGGRVVNVSSRGAFRGEPTAPAYGASKAGMNAMGQSLAVALAPHNIFVATVAPGFVQTDMAADILDSERGAAIREQSPLGRVATPEEVAYTVLFLAAEQTAFLTGCIVDVNGASYLRS